MKSQEKNYDKKIDIRKNKMKYLYLLYNIENMIAAKGILISRTQSLIFTW